MVAATYVAGDAFVRHQWEEGPWSCVVLMSLVGEIMSHILCSGA